MADRMTTAAGAMMHGALGNSMAIGQTICCGTKEGIEVEATCDTTLVVFIIYYRRMT